jgi:hypothetical protein
MMPPIRGQELGKENRIVFPLWLNKLLIADDARTIVDKNIKFCLNQLGFSLCLESFNPTNNKPKIMQRTYRGLRVERMNNRIVKNQSI